MNSRLMFLSVLMIAGLAQPGMAQEPARDPAASAGLDETIASSLAKVISKIETTKGRVAVMDFPALDGKATGLSTYIANKAGNKLIEAGRQVVDRATLEKVIAEQKLQQNSLMDTATAAKIGKLTGAGVFLIGNYTVMSSKFVITVRALAVETGQFIPGAVAEETVKPIPAEMMTEIRELQGQSANAGTQANLSGDASDSAPSMSNEREAELKKEVAFLMAACRVINKNMDFGKLIKLAYENDQLPEYQQNGLPYESRCSDSLGEESHPSNSCYSLSSFQFEVEGYLAKEDVAKGIKGKAIRSKVLRWTYNGPDNLPGLDKCAPDGANWNESRGGGTVGGKSKKKH